ncbi:hypothetical protein ACT3T8_00195 [Halomonas sp. AOP1-B1-8]|nr:hypothetical protein [Halomonas sp.]
MPSLQRALVDANQSMYCHGGINIQALLPLVISSFGLFNGYNHFIINYIQVNPKAQSIVKKKAWRLAGD